MGNNTIINDPPYYMLPCGRFVEDYLWIKRVPFWLGSLLKYRFRAGKKDGESCRKDCSKDGHYLTYAVVHDCYGRDRGFWEQIARSLYDEMLSWDGDDMKVVPFELEY